MDNNTAQHLLDGRRLGQSEDNNLTEGTATIQVVSNAFVLNIVERINELYHFKNFIFYISERLDLKNENSLDFFREYYNHLPLAPNLIFTRNYNASMPMVELISTPSLVMVYTTERDDPIMELVAERLRGLRWLKTVFILYPKLSTPHFHLDFDTLTDFSNMLNNTFEWVWNKQFLNTVLITIQNNVYLLDPYPTLSILNKTESWNVSEFFYKHSKNMKHYVLKTPILYDLPRVFKSDRPTNSFENNYVHGTSGNLFFGFLKFVNANILDTSSNMSVTLNLPNLLELVAQGVYETLIHSFTDMIGNYSVSYSYPIGINDWCIMVPYRNQSPAEDYIREALENSAWLMLFVGVLYMTIAIWFCSPLRPRDFSAAFLQTICTLTYSPPIRIIKTPTSRIRYLYVLLFVMGLVSSNMYISKMTSYFTTAPPQKQLNTMQDIVEANLRILLMNFEYDHIKRLPHQYPEDFQNQLDVVEKEQLDYYRDPLNVSYGYAVTSDRWRFLDMQQKHLKKPIFRLTDICSGPFYHVFPLHLDSHLQSPLQTYIMIAQHAGLMHHWKREAFWEALHLHKVYVAIADEEPRALDLSFFSSMLRIWCLGCVLAGFSFAAEMKWYQYFILKRQRNPTRRPRSFLRRLHKKKTGRSPQH